MTGREERNVSTSIASDGFVFNVDSTEIYKDAQSYTEVY